ncbi:uncharacterized protein LOC133887201 [Phragmites australis]|uniref:uncharacterized protein LOC133887201 n=1 Tax=Phragmites australis TaxID=29695 RepID=UPI002D783A98|nr:uncharacterized protein LOC133887201 [Phragmites australis]
MDDFTFPTLHAGGQCKQLPLAFPHQLGLGSPPPWFAAVVASSSDGEEQDKMDMLWEDFNEELASAPPLCPLSPLINKGEPMMKEAWLDDVIGDIVDPEKHGGRLRLHDGRVVRRRRWSLLLMLRLLKKLFLVKKSRNPRTAPI